MTYTWQSKDRQYRTAESIRQQNLREERLLQRKINMPRGMNDACRYHIATMTKEQNRVRRELETIKNVIPSNSCNAFPPPTKAEVERQKTTSEKGAAPSVHNIRYQNALQQRHQEKLNRFRESFPLQDEPPLRNVADEYDAMLSARIDKTKPDCKVAFFDVNNAKENVEKRLLRQTAADADELDSRPQQQPPQNDKEEPVTNCERNASHCNPDGTLKTMYTLPNFIQSLSEARKARYIRHREKQWFEKELTVKAIFDPNAHNVET